MTLSYMVLLGIAFFVGFHVGRLSSLNDILKIKYKEAVKTFPDPEDPADWWKK